MDRFVNKKIEKQTIYEIYRACRLCGAGGGYKMPIIQNVVNLDSCDVELKQKIRECVQIEVHQGDKMPPLICELCVDKVNDFYEFLEMCRQTNKRTRLKLGLPPQMMPRWAPDAGDCILGVTEPIFVNDEDSNEPLADKKTKAKGGKPKKEPEKKWKLEDTATSRESRSSRRRPPSPPRRDPGNVMLSRHQSKVKKSLSPPPKSILKKAAQKKPETSPQPPSTRLKRAREADVKQDTLAKRVKISLKHLPPRSSKASPRQGRQEAERSRPRSRQADKISEAQTACPVCGAAFKTPQAMFSHRRSHLVSYTNPKLACNACEAWFASAEEAEAHQRRHRQGLRYRCRRCAHSFVKLQAFEEHVEKGKCIPWEEVPDVKCDTCWKTFPTQTMLDGHRCAGPGARPGKCVKCGKNYASQKSLTNHTRSCRKGNVVISPELRRRLVPMQVRVAKCDPLLANVNQEHYDVSGVEANFGLDKNCVYPYISGLKIKKEPSDCMVKIIDLDFESYVHWDSDDDSEDSDVDNLDGLDLNSFTRKRKIDSLAACALKTIFSNRFLGKMPRKFRRVKIENIIDSALNDSLSDLNINDDTVSIQKDITVSDDKFNDSDELTPRRDSADIVTNDDFDRLFSGNSDKPDCDDSGGGSALVSDKLVSLGDKDSDERVKKISDDLGSGAKDVLDKENSDSGNVIGNDKNIDLKQSTNENIEKIAVKEKSSDSEIQHSQDNQSDGNRTLSEQKVCLKTEVNSDRDPENGVNDGSQTKRTMCRLVNNNNENVSPISDEDRQQDLLVNSYSDTNIQYISENNEYSDNNKESQSGDEHILKHTRGMETAKSEKSESIIISEADTDNERREDTRGCPKKNDENSEHNIPENNITNETDVKVNETEINGDVDSDGINMNELEELDSTEYTDCELMAEIDAQIGQKNHEEPVERMEIDKQVNNIEEATKIDKHAVDNNLKLDGNGMEVSEEAIKNTEIADIVKEKEDNETDTDMKQDKITLEDLLPKGDGPCMDLDSISDEDFDFNDD